MRSSASSRGAKGLFSGDGAKAVGGGPHSVCSIRPAKKPASCSRRSVATSSALIPVVSRRSRSIARSTMRANSSRPCSVSRISISGPPGLRSRLSSPRATIAFTARLICPRSCRLKSASSLSDNGANCPTWVMIRQSSSDNPNCRRWARPPPRRIRLNRPIRRIVTSSASGVLQSRRVCGSLTSP